MARPLRAAFVLIAIAWVVLLAAAPTAAFGGPASGVVYAMGSLVCHQRPERSFHVGLAQLPVCARCSGLYMGAALGAVATLAGRSRRRDADAAALLRAVLVGAAAPTAVTWTAEALGLWAPSNLVRCAAALPLGAAVAITVNYVECARPPRSGPSPPRPRI